MERLFTRFFIGGTVVEAGAVHSVFRRIILLLLTTHFLLVVEIAVLLRTRRLAQISPLVLCHHFHGLFSIVSAAELLDRCAVLILKPSIHIVIPFFFLVCGGSVRKCSVGESVGALIDVPDSTILSPICFLEDHKLLLVREGAEAVLLSLLNNVHSSLFWLRRWHSLLFRALEIAFWHVSGVVLTWMFHGLRKFALNVPRRLLIREFGLRFALI